MVVTILNAAPAESAAQVLLSHHLTPFADVDVIAGQTHYPAHRAVLAVHSLDFREAFSSTSGTSTSTTSTSTPSTSPRATTPTTTPNVTSSSASPTIVLNPSSSYPTQHQQSKRQVQHQQQPERYRVHIAIDDIDDRTLRTGWSLIYSYIYGACINLDTETVLAALPICRRYRFDELANALDNYLCDAAVSPDNCIRVYTAAGIRQSSQQQSPVTPSASTSPTTPRRTKRGRRGDVNNNVEKDRETEMVQNAAWQVMKSEFSKVTDWGIMAYGSLVRLLKLNDLNISSELTVFEVVKSWINANDSSIDVDIVAGLIKLIRFPTMTIDELEVCASSELVRSFPVCRKYVSRGIAAKADESRGLIRNVVMESSPVYRKRRVDALTFSDRITSFRKVYKNVHTSSRYFSNCLWNLIVEISSNGDWIGLYLGCLSETEDKDVDVELDFSVFIVKHTGGSNPELHTKEIKGACFSTSGQRIGFPNMIKRCDIEADGSRYLLRDTLFIGASIRLRSSEHPVAGITERDDSAQSISTMI